MVLFLSGIFAIANGQGENRSARGKISYFNSMHIYVKFQDRPDIVEGDTLYRMEAGQPIPAMVVDSRSSFSLVCESLGGFQPETGLEVFAPVKSVRDDFSGSVKKNRNARERAGQVAFNDIDSIQADQQVRDKPEKKVRKGPFSGKLSASTYNGFSGEQDKDYMRMRYRLYVSAKDIGNTGVSAETYASFNHRKGEWNRITENLYDGLKIYALNVTYEAKTNTGILLGRKINRQLSNVGAIDGLQINQKLGNFSLGGVIGSRPDHSDYSFNPSLLQYGGYMGYTFMLNDRPVEHTVAFMEQRNGARTDRRFLYFQHSSRLLEDLFLFASAEMNLYKVEAGQGTGTFELTSLYTLLRYRASKRLSLSVSYDMRNNVIYYETYRNYLDQLIDQGTRQGLHVSVHYRISDFISLGARGSYRYRADDPAPGKNISAYAVFTRLPVSGMRVTVNSNLLQTSYLSGVIAGMRLDQELIPGLLSGGLYYRIFNGHYSNQESSTLYHTGEIYLRWEIYKRIALMASYEGMAEDTGLSNRMYLNLTWRF